VTSRPLGPTLGSGLLFATLGCFVIALPAALRSSASLVMAWLVLASSTALVLAPAAALLRVARPFPRQAWSVPLGFLLALPPLIVFARILKVGTHHRPLGGATFAIVALGVVLGAIALAARALSWEKPILRKLVIALAGLLALASVALALPVLTPPLRGHVLDAVLAFALLGVVAFVKLPEPKTTVLAGPIVWVVVGLIGISLGSPELRALLADRAPVLAGVTAWLR
jgi:hypothetical protein